MNAPRLIVLLLISHIALAQTDWAPHLSQLYLDDVEYTDLPISQLLAELNTHTKGEPQLHYQRSRTADEPRVTLKQELTSVWEVLLDVSMKAGLHMHQGKDRIHLQHRSMVTRNRLQTIILPKIEIKDVPHSEVGPILSELADPLDKQLTTGGRTPICFRGHRVLEHGDPPVTYSAQNVRLDSAIKAIVTPLGFEWTIRFDTVWVYPSKRLIVEFAALQTEGDPFDEDVLPDPPDGF
jgi:hypothetical protein